MAQPARQPVELNDVHSRLNTTLVRGLAQPQTIEQLAGLIERARRERLAISISGGRHAMGGQQFAVGALHIDMSKMNRLVALDRTRGIVTVEAGIQWPALIDRLLQMQAGEEQPWSIVQKQTGADGLSLGGALSANVHGRGLALRPFVQDVEAFRLMQADGREIEVSRQKSPELFRLTVGGYGLFGVITTIDVRLQRRTKLRRDVEIVTLDALHQRFAERIEAGYAYGDFQFKTDERAPDFLQAGVFSAYKPVPSDTAVPEQRALAPADWRRLFALAHLDKARAFAAYSDYYRSTSGQIYWSDTHQLSYYDADFEDELRRAAPGYPAGSLMITEVYVPRPALADFMGVVGEDFRANGTNLVYGTVRLIERDTETFLPWAREDYACIVMNLRVTHTPSGIEKARVAFQRLIDRALERRGSYYLTYHRWARKDQVMRAYPEMVEFLKLKRRYDPQERFQSEWYRHYKTMFAEELARP
ncbi:MAG: FAD-binding protein [Steroidobacteraceae bacterium]